MPPESRPSHDRVNLHDRCVFRMKKEGSDTCFFTAGNHWDSWLFSRLGGWRPLICHGQACSSRNFEQQCITFFSRSGFEACFSLRKGVPSVDSSRSMWGLGKGVSGEPYPRLCNARRPRLEPGTFRSQAVRLYRLHQARPSS